MDLPPPAAPGLFVRSLDQSRFALAHPLAKTAIPDLSLTEWQRFLDEHLKQPASGIVTVENSRGIMLACAAYCVRPDLQHGQSLMVDPLIVMDLVGSKMVAQLLDQHLQWLARELRCAGLHLQLPVTRSTAAEERGLSAFRGCGMAADALRLSKAVVGLEPAA
ncbi:MAG: hypothetical protein RIC87_06035 [Kiloniellales bacterium]